MANLRQVFVLSLLALHLPMEPVLADTHYYLSPTYLTDFKEPRQEGFEISMGRIRTMHSAWVIHGLTARSVQGLHSVGPFISTFGITVGGGVFTNSEKDRAGVYGTLGFSMGYAELSYFKPLHFKDPECLCLGLKIPLLWNDSGTFKGPARRF